jgi:peptidoglycan/xylan/chitin deacetylase (PgdA/CDA1 family)
MRKVLFCFFLMFAALLLSSCASKGPTEKTGVLIWHGDPSSKNVFLTFDDGPTSEATVQILDILKKYNVVATFFVLGRKADRNPGVIRRIHDEGHDIGNHTYKHVGGLNVTWEVISRELNKTDAAIKKACGVSPKFFRPPFGFFNYRYFMVAEKMGYRSVLWTIDAGDWKNLTSTEVEQRLIPKVKGGYIILLHDGGASREADIQALPRIITGIEKKGFRFRKLSDL